MSSHTAQLRISANLWENLDDSFLDSNSGQQGWTSIRARDKLTLVGGPNIATPLRVFRAMLKGPSGRPPCGSAANQLGVRPGTDIPVDPGKRVHPQTGGMSVTPDEISRLPPHVRPQRLPGGRGNLPVFELATSALSKEVVLRRDPKNTFRHAFLEPATSMLLDELQAVLCATGSSWKEA